MSRTAARRLPVNALLAAALLVVTVATGCAQQVTGTPSAAGGPAPAADPAAPAPAAAAPAAPGAAPATLAPGPVTVVALGDSLTAGVGDEVGQGFVSRLTDAIGTRPGREGSTLVNLGQSGWDSTSMVEGQPGSDGQPGSPAELPQGVEAARAAAPGTVLATVLIGSNDLWYVYAFGAENPTPPADEEAAVATYRRNLERTVQEMQAAGAVVVVGLPDDQSLRPVSVDITRVQAQLPDVTEEEVGRMSELSKVLGRTASEVAAAHGARTVDTNDAFWADPARMDPDGIHPNAAGYTEMANRWVEAAEPLL